MTRRPQTCIRLVLLLGLLIKCIVLNAFSVAEAGIVETLIDAHKQSVAKSVQKAISKADTLANEGNYSKAFRILFDADRKEERTWFLFSSGKESPMLEAHHALNALKRRLLHEDQSPLIQWLRNIEVPLQERLITLSHLQKFIDKNVKRGETVVFQGQYQGPLVQIVTSRHLRSAEKYEILKYISSMIQASYVSEGEREDVAAPINQLQQEADRRFQQGAYVEAFVLIERAMQKADEIEFELVSPKNDDDLYTQRAQMRRQFVQEDTSLLMHVFKDRQIPTRDRQYLLYDLRDLLVERSLSLDGKDLLIIDGVEYTGAFVQILTHPDISWTTKEFLLITIEAEILKKEPDYTPDWLLPPKE